MGKKQARVSTVKPIGDAHDALRLWLHMFRMTRSVEKLLRARLRSQCNTTMPRFEVLSTLDHAQGQLTMSQLSDQILVSNGNVTGLVHRLVGDGLVTRTADPNDRRAHFISLTELGRTAFHIMEDQHHMWIEDLFSRVDPRDKKMLLKLLGKMEEGYQEEISAEIKLPIEWTDHTYDRLSSRTDNDKPAAKPVMAKSIPDDKLSQLEHENQRLKNLLAEQMLNNATLKHLLSQKI
jgi:DNA-binding MarR family transcriptional regulator